MAFLSCSDGGGDEAAAGEAQVRFSATIGQQALSPQTRAEGATWAAGDAIGVFMVENASGTTIAEGAENRQFTTPDAANFLPLAGDEINYPMNDAAVDFIAYYPYRAGTTLAAPIDIETGDQTAQPAFDLLRATADNGGVGYNKTTHENTPVALAFEHQLAKLVMNCKADASVGATLDHATVGIAGMKTRATFDLATGTLGTPATVAPVTPRKTATAAGYDASYDAIILPCQYAAGELTVTFTLGTEQFVWRVDAVTFAPGNAYIYDVTLTRTGVQVTGTIKDWTGNNQGNATAD